MRASGLRKGSKKKVQLEIKKDKLHSGGLPVERGGREFGTAKVQDQKLGY